MHDFGRVAWQSLTARAVLFLDQPEDLGEFTDRLFGSWHQGVTASNRWNLRHPAVGPVPVDCELIIVEAQAFTVVRKALAA